MSVGKTRNCPHCKAVILDSMPVCPGCNHHLRFDPASLERMQPAGTPFKVEGSIRHPPEGAAWEYSIMLVVRNEKGDEISRQVAGVGAMQPSEQRTFALSVELFTPRQVSQQVADAPPAEDPHTATGTFMTARFPSVFRDARRTSAAAGTTGVAGSAEGPPPLPRDPRPQAQPSRVRVFPAGTQAPRVAPPGKPPK